MSGVDVVAKVAATIVVLAIALGVGGVAVSFTIDPPYPWPWFLWPLIVILDLCVLAIVAGALRAVWHGDPPPSE